jgi:hypothetical protein
MMPPSLKTLQSRGCLASGQFAKAGLRVDHLERRGSGPSAFDQMAFQIKGALSSAAATH